jgi:protein-tyrosine phosphatase
MTAVLKLASVPNFRDVAGPAGYKTPNGRMRRGQLYRSNTFIASPEDLATLASVGVVAIHDLRGQREIDLRPDSVLPGAVWRHMWVPGLGKDLMLVLDSAPAVREAMLDHYRGFVAVPEKRAAIARVLVGLSEHEGPQVFHCSEGKDRTGWVAMLLQRLAGASDEDVVTDFLMTNELMAGYDATRDIAKVFFGDKPNEIFVPVMVADVAYLEAGHAQVEADYGDVDTYLRKGLGLTDDQLDRLRRLLVE